MKKIELLAPAGSMESLISAVNAGADAVYIGGDKFSARAKAANFTKDKIIESVSYLKPYGVKLYPAVNTLIKDEEMNEALDYLEFLYKAGADAVIIQDLGLFKKAKTCFPGLELHASTQMTIHNLEGARLLKSLGYSRVVLSRELSLKEIKDISKEIETEIFIHGALCISYSGACLLSSLIGGNSGNRGRCSQPCRLKYSLEGKSGYLLSPKDVCTLNNIEDIIGTGTSSLKIEGRMKSPAYVSAVVSIYRKAIDAALRGDKIDLKEENKVLLKVFNREGFSKAYLYGNTGKEMMAYNFPRNTGLILGKVKNGEVYLQDDINCRDGIRIGDTGFNIEKLYKNGKEVTDAKSCEKVKIKPDKFNEGDILYKTYDYKLENEMEKFGEKYFKKVPLSLEIDFNPLKPLHLKTEFNGETYEYYGEETEEAKSSPLTKERIAETLKKSKDTPFVFNDIRFSKYEPGFLRIASLNEARRQLIKSIQDKKINREIKRESCKEEGYSIEKKIIAAACNMDQVRAISEFKNIDLAVNPFLFDLNIDEIDSFILKLPTVIKGEFDDIINLISKYKSKINGIITSNLGIIKRLGEDFKICGDYKMNITNSSSLSFVNSLGVTPMASLELNRKELGNLKYPYSSLIYGRAEVMISEYNLIESVLGISDKKIHVLKDRKGEEFPAAADKFGRTNIYNSHILNLIEYKDDLIKIKSNVLRLDFLEEGYDVTKLVLESFINGKKSEGSWTYGHFKRGVL